MSDIEMASKILQQAGKVLVITGAGISAESGIPTFRGEDGYWRGHKPEDLASPQGFQANPRLVWDWYLERRNLVARVNPNAAHHALANWSKHRGGIALVTQNVDGLHQRAGQDEVIEIHGSLWKNRCRACGYSHKTEVREYKELPICPACKSTSFGPGVVWFGEGISFDNLHQTNLAFLEARAILVIGTSGVVSPIADFLAREKRYKTPIINVNPEATAVEADLYLKGKATEILPQLLAV